MKRLSTEEASIFAENTLIQLKKLYLELKSSGNGNKATIKEIIRIMEGSLKRYDEAMSIVTLRKEVDDLRRESALLPRPVLRRWGFLIAVLLSVAAVASVMVSYETHQERVRLEGFLSSVEMLTE